MVEKARILIVEDESIIALDIKKTLTNFGYDVLAIVSRGEDVLNCVVEKNPNLVLMDIVLKGKVDGIEAARQLQKHVDVPVIYLTAHTDTATVQRLKKTAPYGLLIKPVSESELYSTIETALYRHKLDIRLRLSTKKYRDLFEQSRDAIYIRDADGIIVDANQSMLDMVGCSRRDLLGTHINKIYSDRNTYDFITGELLKNGYVRDAELDIRRGDGSLITCMLTLSPQMSESGQLRGYQGILRDITHLKKATALIEETGQKLRIAAECAHDIIYEWDVTNNRFTEIAGNISELFKIDELCAVASIEDHLRFIHPDDRGWVQEKAKKIIMTGQRFEEAYRCICGDGTAIVISNNGMPIRDQSGKVVKIIGACSDITERKKIEEQLVIKNKKMHAQYNELQKAYDLLESTIQKSNELNRELEQTQKMLIDANTIARKSFELNPLSMFVTKISTGEVIEVNPTFCETFGFDRGEIIRKTSQELDIWVDPNTREYIEKSLLEQGRINNLDFEMKTKTGERKWVLFCAELLHYEAIDERFILSIFEDITRRKHIEQQLEWSLMEKDTLLSEIHHRVKNNMQIVSSLLNLQMPYVKDESTRQILINSKNRIKSMAILHEILYKSRDFSRIDISDFVMRIVANLSSSYSDCYSRVKIIKNIDDIAMSFEKIIHVGLLVNELVSNSFKHAFPPGKTGEIRIDIRRLDDSILIRIADNGVGFPDGFALEVSGSLGLQLVETLTKQLQGVISVDNDNGAVFTVQFVNDTSIS